MKVFRSLHLFTLFLAAFTLAASSPAVQAGELCVEAQLIWGTNDEKSPNPKHKQVDAELARKLGDSFKWRTYFQEERHTACVPDNQGKKLKMSQSCMVDIKNLGSDKIEVKLIGEGKPVVKNTGSLANGELVVIGGDAKNDTAWFIVLRKVAKK